MGISPSRSIRDREKSATKACLLSKARRSPPRLPPISSSAKPCRRSSGSRLPSTTSVRGFRQLRKAAVARRAGGLMVQSLSAVGREGGDVRQGAGDEDWRRVKMLAATVEDHELLDPELRRSACFCGSFTRRRLRLSASFRFHSFADAAGRRWKMSFAAFGASELSDMHDENGRLSSRASSARRVTRSRSTICAQRLGLSCKNSRPLNEPRLRSVLVRPRPPLAALPTSPPCFARIAALGFGTRHVILRLRAGAGDLGAVELAGVRPCPSGRRPGLGLSTNSARVTLPSPF